MIAELALLALAFGLLALAVIRAHRYAELEPEEEYEDA